MPTPKPTSFQVFVFSPEELLQSNLLSPLLKMRVQTLLADTAEQILSLVYDPNNPLEFVQQDANLKGQLAVYQLFLQEDEDAQAKLLTQTRANQL